MSRSGRYAKGGKKAGERGSGISGRLTAAMRQGGTPGSIAAAREVDLHLPAGHAAAEALERQLARVRGEIKSAIKAGEKEIIFIHGAGSGRLREALRDIIVSEYPSCTFHDASFTRYGYNGATTVIIRK